jgi:hypothetical protein
MPDFDKGARYLAKQDPPGFIAWLFGPAATSLVFVGWLDTRRLALPVEEDRTCDMVAAFRLAAHLQPTHVLIIDFKAEATATALGQMLGYVVRLHTEPPQELATPPQVGGAVINLSGRRQRNVVTVDFPRVPACSWKFSILQRTLRDESASATLAGIAAGRTTRWLLPWIPLMRGGGQAAIIEEWKQAAAAEPDSEVRATLGGLALVFAELTKRAQTWREGLRGWDVRTSRIVEEWREEGRMEGALATARDDLYGLLMERFGRVPKIWEQRIQAATDLDRLKAAMRQVLHIQKLNELQL